MKGCLALLPLHEQAQRRAAFSDDSVYLYAIARVHQLQQRWPEALERFREVLAISERLHDHNGIAYAEHGIAQPLLNLRRASEARPHARRALQTIDVDAGPREGGQRSVTGNGRGDTGLDQRPGWGRLYRQHRGGGGSSRGYHRCPALPCGQGAVPRQA